MSFPKRMSYQGNSMEWVFYKQYNTKQEAIDDEVNRNFTTRIEKDKQNGRTVYGIYRLSNSINYFN